MNQSRGELLVMNKYRLRLDRAPRFRLSVMNAFYLFPSISEEADPLHGYNYTRRYPIGKGSSGVNSWPVSLARRMQGGEAGQIQGARSKAGKGEGLARDPWPVDQWSREGLGREP